MSEYLTLKKYIKSYNTASYNNETDSGYWRSTTLDGLDVWYILIPIEEHTILEPNCKAYKLNINSTYEEYEPHKLIIDTAYNIYLYVRVDSSDSFNSGKLNGKLLIF